MSFKLPIVKKKKSIDKENINLGLKKIVAGLKFMKHLPCAGHSPRPTALTLGAALSCEHRLCAVSIK